MARSRQYIEWVKAAHVFPCAGPPCFLDDDLFRFNDLDDDPRNIFPDQAVFLAELAAAGVDNAALLVPGSVVELEGGDCRVSAPAGVETVEVFARKAAYLDEYRADWAGWLAAEHESWTTAPRDLVADLGEWFAPLMEAAPITSAGIAGNVVIEMGPEDAVCLDFVERSVREWAGEPYVYKITVDRRLITRLVDEHVEDWVNSLFLSCRFGASRARTVQRVRDDVLQGARPGTDRVRRAQLPPSAPGRRVLRTRRLADRAVVPAPAGRSHPLRRDQRRRAHVLAAPLAVRARVGAVPDERGPAPPLRTSPRLTAVLTGRATAREAAAVGRVAFNHVGQCVTDLERSKRFYTELLGFTLDREIQPTDDLSSRLMGLTPPLGLTAAYLVRDGLVLELLHYAAEGQTQPFRPRALNEPGLTHLSVSVEDVDGTLARVPELGGEVLAATNIGFGVFVRDPDGQLLEILPIAYRDGLDAR